MMLSDINIERGTTVGVMGLGVTGRSAVEYFVHCGARVIISDARDEVSLERELASLHLSDSRFESGEHTFDFLRNAHLVFKSPGIADDHPVVSRLREAGIPVVGELAIAAPFLNAPVIAVTGTNGKTTVTELIGEICSAAGKKVFVGGNIGTPLFEYLRNNETADVIVLEVSSFQLEHLNSQGFRPEVALILNITPDHLDRHGDLEGYARAKGNLIKEQRSTDTVIVYDDDPWCAQLARSAQARVLRFGETEGADAFISGKQIMLNGAADEQCYSLEGCALATKTGMLNSGAAILATTAIGIEMAAIIQGLKEFAPAPHRLEFVAEVDGVQYVNDSKATNTGAVIAALNQLSGEAVLIAGGKDKGDDYTLMRDIVSTRVAELIVIGEAADKITRALHGCAPTHSAASLDDAVELAGRLAKNGQTVLLSPACASFDMFASYGHRGDMFRDLVKQRAVSAKLVGVENHEQG